MAALGLKANVSEADHPLLCEGTRRQRYVIYPLRYSIRFNFLDPYFLYYISVSLFQRRFGYYIARPLQGRAYEGGENYG